jgi:pimeloyl-ACP methyl ester carboxylesterase
VSRATRAAISPGWQPGWPALVSRCCGSTCAGHGESEGRQEDLTLCGVANDIRAAVQTACAQTGVTASHLYGTSFSGGVCAWFAVRHPGQVKSLVLANPLLNYKKRFIDDKPYWHHDQIDKEAGRLLAGQGFVEHSPTFRRGRALLNELFYIRPDQEIGQLTVPTLFVHGTRDTFIPVESSRAAVLQISGAQARLAEIDGAQHGFAVHDDPQYLQPQTQEWQSSVITLAAEWMTAHYQ